MVKFSTFKNTMINMLIHFLPTKFISFKHERNHRNNPSLWVNDDYFFLHIPKSGGTSVAKCIDRTESGHFKFSTLINKYPEIGSKKVYFFVVRNPIDRIISTYTYVKDLHRKYGTSNLPEIEFSDSLDSYIINFLKNTNVNEHYFLRPFSEVVKGVPESKLYGINFEGLSSNVSDFYKDILSQKINMPHSNKSTLRSDLYISKESEKIIRQKYKNDFDIYNKVKDHNYIRL